MRDYNPLLDTDEFSQKRADISIYRHLSY
jgi:hypothetical protein